MGSYQRWRVEPIYYYYCIVYHQYAHTVPYQIRTHYNVRTILRSILIFNTFVLIHNEHREAKQRAVLNQSPVK